MFSCRLEKKIGMLELRCELEVPYGELLVVFGPSGCGKTTLMNLITGILRPDAGYIRVDDRVLYSGEGKLEMPINQRHIGYIQQGGYLFPHMSVKQNILYGVRGRPKLEDEKLYHELIETMGLKAHENTYPKVLSGGQRQRVAIARALMMRPALLLWDEPFSALDHNIRSQMRILVRQIKESFETPMVFVTHDIDEALELADRIALMDAGKFIQKASPSDLFSQCLSGRAGQIIGLDRKNGNGEALESLAVSLENLRSSAAADKVIQVLKDSGFSVQRTGDKGLSVSEACQSESEVKTKDKDTVDNR